MKALNTVKTIAALGVATLLLQSAAFGALVTSGDLEFDNDTSVIAGSGQLGTILFTGNSVSNPSGIPDPNQGMPTGSTHTFTGDWPVPGDTETFTVAEALAQLHSELGPTFNELAIFIDANEPRAEAVKMFTVDVLTITIGSTTFSTAGGVVLLGFGSGQSNYLVRGTGPLGINLTAFDPSDTISVHLKLSDLDGGFEELFLSGLEGAVVPEPATMMLMGLGIAMMRLKRIAGKRVR